jgi:5,10-methylenetetrahydromethanopterin reductase
MEYGAIFASSFEAVQQARLAEKLGFSSVGFYDSPALEPDVWITIANVAQATSRIKVGSEVLVPHLRHPMAQAAAMATIEHLAPGRLFVGVGTGFTGRMAMGLRPLTWASMRTFLTTVKSLLAGERTEIDGAVTQMLHPPEFAPARPIVVPFLVAANGPVGVRVAREVGDGLIFAGDSRKAPTGFPILKMNTGGIVVGKGETASSPRVIDACRIAFPMQYHLAYEGFTATRLQDLPYGLEWLETVERHPEDSRHLVIHDWHTVGINHLDADFMARHPDAVAEFVDRTVISPTQLRERIIAISALGATHTTCATGGDWRAALHAYADAVGLSHVERGR